VHPVDVATQGIDFTVMRDVAIRVTSLPTWEGIRAKAGVYQRQRAFHIRIVEVGIILPHLHRHQHSFVNNRAAREAGWIPVWVYLGRTDGGVRSLADDVELPLKSQVVSEIWGALDENLLHERFTRFRRIAQRRIVRRHIAPAQNLLPFLSHDCFKNLATLLARGGIRRAIYHTNAILSRFWQHDVLGRRHLLQELVRHLHQNASSVAGVRFSTARTPVVDVQQDRQRLLYDLVRLLPLHVYDEPDAAGVMLKLWIVEALFWWQFVTVHFDDPEVAKRVSSRGWEAINSR